ncbi:MAG: hypothetical protein JWP16_1333 [Alphaproteobacteria bacterium]|nr:hypothetical protein [Alphaproteobacteria bacterium]MDB5740293.1 hypothetical protein [Alphaproteobacteria bacterium]
MIKRFVIVGGVASLLLGGAVLAQPSGAPAAPGSEALRRDGGERLFTINCGGCHGYDMAGGAGPSLFADALLSRRTDDMLLRTIRNGIPGTRMPPWKALLDDEQIRLIIAYARNEGARQNGR